MGAVAAAPLPPQVRLLLVVTGGHAAAPNPQSINAFGACPRQLHSVSVKCTWFYIAGCLELGRAKTGGEEKKREEKTEREVWIFSTWRSKHLQVAPGRELGAVQGGHHSRGPSRRWQEIRTHQCAHTEAHAASPHTAHPDTPSLRPDDPGGHSGPSRCCRTSAAPPEQKGGQGGPRIQPSPARVTAGTFPASFLPGKHVRPAADATTLQSGLAGMRWCSRSVGSTGSSCGANTASCPHLLHPSSVPTVLPPALPYLHKQPPRVLSPFQAPVSPQHGGVSADVPGGISTGEDPPVLAAAPWECVSHRREVKQPPRWMSPCTPRATGSLCLWLHICFPSVPRGEGTVRRQMCPR